MSILITTSRNPGKRTRSFCNDLKRSLPRSRYKNRGKSGINQLFSEVGEKDRILFVSQKFGNPSGLEVFDRHGNSHLKISIKRVVLSREQKDNFGYGPEGKEARLLSSALEIDDPVILQKTQSILIINGPEMGLSIEGK